MVFSSVVIHRSGANTTDRMHRVYLAQYSNEVIPAKGSTEPQGSFERFLSGGEASPNAEPLPHPASGP